MTPTMLPQLPAFQAPSLVHLVAQVSASPPAQGSGGARGPAGPQGPASPLAGPLPMLLMFAAIFYFMVFRPMSKQRKEQEELHKSLAKGDRVVTRGGMVGTITGMDDKEVVLEVAERVRVKFLRSAIEGKYDASAPAKAAEAAVEKKS